MRECGVGHFVRLLVFGVGDLVLKRLALAIGNLYHQGRLAAAAFVDIVSVCPPPLAPLLPPGLDWSYFPTAPDTIPFEALRAAGYLQSDVATYLASPTDCHLPQAEQLARKVGAVFVEKPFTRSLGGMEDLLLQAPVNVYPIAHPLFKASMSGFLAACGRNVLSDVAWLEFRLMERIGVGLRQIDPALWDLVYHAFELFLSVCRATGADVAIEIGSAVVGTFRPCDGQVAPQVTTAARVEGTLRLSQRRIGFAAVVGKGLSETVKNLVARDAGGRILWKVDLGESGHLAHQRLLTEALGPRPDMKLSLADSLAMVRACTEADAIAVDAGTYAFGRTPQFLAGPRDTLFAGPRIAIRSA